MAQLLVIDDEPSIGWGISQIAERMGHQVEVASSAEQGLDAAQKLAPDLIILDVRLPGMNGLDAMQSLRATQKDTPIIIMTAFGDLDTAVTAIQRGAFEYIIKPFDASDIEAAINRAVTSRKSAPALDQPNPIGGLVGSSQQMQETFKRIALAASSDAAVMIFGESGTGKELAAKAIHDNSNRSQGPFIVVNLAALSESLAESELFGHVKGAYTDAQDDRTGYLAQADQGTLFLDEVADIPLSLQVKLLRVLESGEFTPVGSTLPIQTDFRIITATHQSLDNRIQSGAFRHDLFFRLAAYQIRMPPLRDRSGDMPLLVAHFLKQIADRDKLSQPEISREALKALESRPWNGNVRELRNTLEHAVIVSRGNLIASEHLPEPMALTNADATPTDARHDLSLAVGGWAKQQLKDEQPDNIYAKLLAAVEPILFQAVLDANRGQFVAASRMLGIHRTTLSKKADEFGLDCQASDNDGKQRGS